MAIGRQEQEATVTLAAGTRLFDDVLDTELRVSYVSDEAVVVATPDRMVALPRRWVEAALETGSLSPV